MHSRGNSSLNRTKKQFFHQIKFLGRTSNAGMINSGSGEARYSNCFGVQRSAATKFKVLLTF